MSASDGTNCEGEEGTPTQKDDDACQTGWGVMRADAQAVIDKYRKKQLLFPTYTFEYDTNDQQQLRALFWADPIAKENYQRFGDMVSFDGTYSSNR
nr:protein FAR1-RELATED SEQUENCE 5-like [Ipomoea batatas]